MAVRAFVDDSGSGGDSRFFVLGGFMADFPTWELFSDAWDAVLRTPPTIEYFKMAEAHNLTDQFAGWSEPDRDAKVNALIDTIHAHHLFQGSCAIQADDYEEVVVPALGNKWKGQYDNPYLHLFMGIVGHLSAMEFRWEYAQRGVAPGKLVVFDEHDHTGGAPQKIDFVFDEGKKLKDRQARTLYEQSMKKADVLQDRLGSVDFRDDKVFVPLQAADLAAWQRRRRLCAKAEGTRQDYERLHKYPGRFKHTTLHRSDLIDTIEHLATTLRSLQP